MTSGEPLVLILMGSDSDLPVMQDAGRVLAEFGVPYAMTVASAHRSPDRAAAYAREAEGRGVRVLIAGAGGAAHLAGVLAAHTALPVIGVPLPGSAVNGLDALLATVQMPAGVPVATVAIGGARNAALLAVQILATADAGLRDRYRAYKARLARDVEDKAAKLTAGPGVGMAPRRAAAGDAGASRGLVPEGGDAGASRGLVPEGGDAGASRGLVPEGGDAGPSAERTR